MKNRLFKNTIITLISFLSIALILSVKKYVHFTMECGASFHGIGFAHKDCTEDIVITSTPEEGIEGTIISGEIYSEGKIWIIPGTSSVKIIPDLDLNLHTDKLSSNGQTITHRTALGGNGGKVKKMIITDQNTTLHYLDSNQNIVFQNLDTSILHYSIYDIYGTLIIEIKKTKLIDNKIPLINLENGIYIINLQLENGELLTKTIMKQ